VIGLGILLGHLIGDFMVQNDWMALRKRKQTWPCLLHCVCYTLAMWVVLAPFFALPWWFYFFVFATHFPIDRYGLALKAMKVAGQESFATGVFAPWSVVIVDNTMHLAVAYYLAALATS